MKTTFCVWTFPYARVNIFYFLNIYFHVIFQCSVWTVLPLLLYSNIVCDSVLEYSSSSTSSFYLSFVFVMFRISAFPAAIITFSHFIWNTLLFSLHSFNTKYAEQNVEILRSSVHFSGFTINVWEIHLPFRYHTWWFSFFFHLLLRLECFDSRNSSSWHFVEIEIEIGVALELSCWRWFHFCNGLQIPWNDNIKVNKNVVHARENTIRISHSAWKIDMTIWEKKSFDFILEA